MNPARQQQRRQPKRYPALAISRPMTGQPSASQAQRIIGMQWQQRTQTKTSEEGTLCTGPSQGCHRKASAHVQVRSPSR